MPGLAAPDRPPAVVQPVKRRAGNGPPLKPVTDSSVWQASDFRHNAWVASLSEQHVQEIEAAVGATIHAHEGRFGRGHVPCPPPSLFLQLSANCIGIDWPFDRLLELLLLTRWHCAAPLTLQSCRIESIRKGDVQLPTLGPLLAEVQAEVVFGRGFALLKGLPVHRWSLRYGVAG